MAAPIYFFARRHRDAVIPQGRLNKKLIASFGLEHVFGDVRDVSMECALLDISGSGPEGHSGFMLQRLGSDGKGGTQAPTRLGYKPEWQTWHKVLDVPAEGDREALLLFLGIDKEEPPTPQDLQRSKLIAGYDVELLDGREWHVPVIRTPWDGTSLPAAMAFDGSGQYTEPLLAQYQPAFDQFGEVVEWFMAHHFLVENRPRALELNLLSLSLNYRYGKPESKVLQLVSTSNYLDCLGAAIDWPKVIELSKKKASEDCEQEATSTSPGPPEETPATGPVGEISS